MEKFKKIKIDGYNYVSLYIIPHQNVKEVGFSQCEQPRKTVPQWYQTQDVKPDIVTNGGLFSIKSGDNILAFVCDGKLYGENVGYRGIGTKITDTSRLVYGKALDENWQDFMSAYPLLVDNGTAITNYTEATELNYRAARTAIGYDGDGNILILIVDKPTGSTGTGLIFSEMAKIFEKYGALYAINLDGGGSTYIMVNGECDNTPTETRSVDNVFYVTLKSDEEINMPTVGNSYYVTRDITLYLNPYEDIGYSSPEQTVKRGEKVKINAIITLYGKQWAIYQPIDSIPLFAEFISSDLSETAPEEVKIPNTFDVDNAQLVYLAVSKCTFSATILLDMPSDGDSINGIESDLAINIKSGTILRLPENYNIDEYSLFYTDDNELAITESDNLSTYIKINTDSIADDTIDTVDDPQDDIISETLDPRLTAINNKLQESMLVTDCVYNGVDVLLNQFTDASKISSWAKESVAIAVEKGWINGVGHDILNSGGYVTREQLCTILSRILTVDEREIDMK